MTLATLKSLRPGLTSFAVVKRLAGTTTYQALRQVLEIFLGQQWATAGMTLGIFIAIASVKCSFCPVPLRYAYGR